MSRISKLTICDVSERILELASHDVDVIGDSRIPALHGKLYRSSPAIVNRLQKVNRVDSMIELFRAWCI